MAISWTGSVPACARNSLDTQMELAAGTKVKVKLGDEEFVEAVPEGKKWATHLHLVVEETDA